MKKLLLLRCSILVVVTLLACGEDENGLAPTYRPYAGVEILDGNGQSGATGEMLNDTLRIHITSQIISLNPEHFVLFPKIINGNGIVSHPSFSDKPAQFLEADSQGSIKALWRLGCGDTQQRLTFYLYNTDSCGIATIASGLCEPIDSVTFNATAKTPHGWNRACGITWSDRHNTKIREYNDKLYAVHYGVLYSLVIKEGMSWEQVPGVPSDEIYDFGFTSTGIIYLLTENNGLYRSSDLRHWKALSNGIQDARYPYTLLVEDSVVYASFMFDGLYRLRTSSGDTWKKLLIDGKYWEEYKFATRHPEGDLYIVDKWDELWVSSNSGDTWTHVPISYQYMRSEAEDFKIDNSGTIYIGSGDASLAILTATNYTGELHSYYKWNSTHQFINNIKFRNGEVYYLVNFTPSPGIYSSTSGWQKVDIGFDKPIHQFAFDPSGNFILGCNDGIYYWKD
jgi:hypothetical protein